MKPHLVMLKKSLWSETRDGMLATLCGVALSPKMQADTSIRRPLSEYCKRCMRVFNAYADLREALTGKEAKK